MDQQTREALESLSETVNTAGWLIMVEDLEKKIEAIKEELTQPSKEVDGDLLRIAQGRILAYRDILSVPASIEFAFKQAEEEKEEE